MAAGVSCGSCGTELRPNARFCDECGAATSAAADTAEYKQVTVLFADVVHSMDIAGALEPERWRDIVAALAECSARVVRRYGGTVKFLGDGVMAIFGAPVALEDHAFRGCLAALAIQQEALRSAAEVARRDGVDLQLRVGLNSGQVIAGDIGAGFSEYTAIGEQVGMAQRMESAAPPGGVLVSDSTARLVEHLAVLAEPGLVHIKGRRDSVAARRLIGVRSHGELLGRVETSLVGRHAEMATLAEAVERVAGGRGGVVNVIGAPGIGKSRTAREIAGLAATRGVKVHWTYCESHATNIPFYVVTRLLRAGIEVAELDDVAARARVRQRLQDADTQDLLLLDDLLGVADPGAALPEIDPDARRRRLTALITTTALERTEPALFIIEDAQWVDEVSESLMTDFLAVASRTASMVLITSRPEYRGALTRVPDAQTMMLVPLGTSDIAALLGEMFGPDPSVSGLSAVIAERAAGNPFFAEEMVRELEQRGALTGERGGYVCRMDVTEVAVPATVQAAIEARIDRLSATAKRTLNAASVIGTRFAVQLLAALEMDPEIEELLKAELIDRVRLAPNSEYAFRHPLIRTVAYESQLKSDRAQWHRRLASAIEEVTPTSVEQNAALIAEHLQAAGDLHDAYRWHMRAATWARYRDIDASRQSWERAQSIADALPAGEPDSAAMRIAPRTMLCGIAWRLHANVAGDHFDELRELCTEAGDYTSLAIGMAGLVIDQAFQGRICEASLLASEAWTLIESLGDPALTVGLSFPLTYAKGHAGEWSQTLRWTQRAIDLADGDPTRGDYIVGSPLAVAYVSRAFARYGLGYSGWPDDLRRGIAMAHSADPLSYATVVSYVYFPGVPLGVLAAHDRAVSEIEDALRIAERSGDDMALAFVRVTLGLALVHGRSSTVRDHGLEVLTDVSEVAAQRGHNLSELRLVRVYLAREQARCGRRDEAIESMLAAVEELVGQRQLLSWGIPATGVLVETLLDRGTKGDLADAEAAVARLAAVPADQSLAIREVWLARMRAQLCRARGDDVAYRRLVRRYCDMGDALGFEGHRSWAEEMAEEPFR